MIYILDYVKSIVSIIRYGHLLITWKIGFEANIKKKLKCMWKL